MYLFATNLNLPVVKASRPRRRELACQLSSIIDERSVQDARLWETTILSAYGHRTGASRIIFYRSSNKEFL